MTWTSFNRGQEKDGREHVCDESGSDELDRKAKGQNLDLDLARWTSRLEGGVVD